MNTTVHFKKTLVAALVMPLLLGAEVGKLWAGPYSFPSDRTTAWNPGLNAVGGIPNRTTIFATLTPRGGSQDDSDAIQAKLDACPAGQVVQLSAGTFTVNNFLIISKSITLRGAGPGMTILQKSNGATLNSETAPDYQPIIIVGPGRYPGPDSSTSQNLTVDGAKGAISVTVANASGFAPGQIVLLDELSGASWQPDRLGRGQIWASPDYRVAWQFHNPALEFVDDPLIATTPTSGDAASWFCRQDRVTTETKAVASVAGHVVTFTTPLHIDYRTSHTAQLTRYTPNGNGGVHVTYAGVENLTATGGSHGTIRFECAAYSWAKNVEVSVWLGEGVAINNSFRVEVRDSYLHDAAWAQPGGAGYAISLAVGTAEVLFENNIFVKANKVMVARCSGAGSVFGYNYVDDGYINTIEEWIEIGLNASHMVGPHHVLFEGNYGFNWDSDHTHGNSIYHTVFRNHLRGIRRPFINPFTGHTVDDATQSNNGPRRCIGATAYSSWMTFVGNVLGAKGKMAGWSYESTGPDGMGTPAIWLLGWDDVTPQPYDAITRGTMIRDGNFDWVTGQQRWDGLIQNNTPGSPQTLPDSLYLSGKPAFFGSNPWPWVDPTTGTIYTLPAQVRFATIVGGEIPPAAPTNLTATAGNAQITLNWVASSGATSYSVYRGTVSGGESTTPIAANLTGTTYTDSGVTIGSSYFYKVQAVNGTGSSALSNEATAVLSSSPSITSANNATFIVGQAGSFTVTATGNPAPTFNAGGLPAWASLNPASGVLSGLPPNASGSPFAITFTATNGVAPDAVQNFTLRVITAFRQWEELYFNAQQLADPAISGPAATPRNDGISNLSKYLFNINPSVTMSSTDRAALPAVGRTTIAGVPYLTLTYRKNATASGINVSVQTSLDLQTWQTVVPDITQDLGPDPVTGDSILRVHVKANGESKKFIRLNVTLP
jgi:hypothetical protein